MATRVRVLDLYKRMLWLGRDWHQGQAQFTRSLSNAFRKNSQEENPEKIEKLIFHAEFVEKEILALYQLKKYRSMKNRYGDHGSYAVECQRIMQAAEADI
ncbi:Oidioi.mRNA.OKI2018_I69.PAR.g12543.t1.cds [Oikopleura dioica]|uniref:Oidioi.mRNA.OKI2018_I69.PAR.g12543.t1.cds n=1 Tax=Oikopleura dioica TaxID=34765 RepID=A0ABN7S6T1_OIKDI|nr:Oidioi.mRNA.OKI2018_I69.PAR.g12543.t1.cds [Oikopleura dioica]